MDKAIFLDRDGVLNPNRGYDQSGHPECPLSVDDYQLFPWTIQALKIMRHLGYRLVVVSNQPAVAKGKMSLKTFWAIHQRMIEELRQGGVKLDGAYYCFHHPDPEEVVYRPEIYLRQCQCRKPEPGLILKAAKKLKIDLVGSTMIGDQEKDVLAGKKVGLRTILVQNGLSSKQTEADYIVPNLLEAAKTIADIGEVIL